MVHITFCLFGKAKMDKEDIVTLNMNLLSTPETPPLEVIPKIIQAVEYKEAFVILGAVIPTERGDLENEDCVIHERYGRGVKNCMRIYYRDTKYLTGERLEAAVDKLNCTVRVEFKFIVDASEVPAEAKRLNRPPQQP